MQTNNYGASEIYAKYKHVGTEQRSFERKPFSFIQTPFKRVNRFTYLTNLKISTAQQTKMEFFINILWDHFSPCGGQQMLSADLEDRASRLIVKPEQNAQGHSVWH